MVRSLAVLLRRLLEGLHRPRHVLRGEHRVHFDSRAQCKEERFHISRDLRCIIHIDDEISTSSAFYVCEVRCLGLKVFEYGLDGLTDPSVPNRRVPLVHGDAEGQHKAHASLLSDPLAKCGLSLSADTHDATNCSPTRTSENAVWAKFADFPFCSVR